MKEKLKYSISKSWDTAEVGGKSVMFVLKIIKF